MLHTLAIENELFMIEAMTLYLAVHKTGMKPTQNLSYIHHRSGIHCMVFYFDYKKKWQS